MASGDTKTNQYLDVAANGTRADLPSDTCCETRSQTLIREVAERIMDVEDEVERLENNPDVADIVATYADLQAYDTSQLTDKDVIRVLQDETHDGDSTYYRWSTETQSWTYIGESKQYTAFVGTDGTSAGTAGLVPAPATTDADKFLKSDGTWAEAGGGGGTGVEIIKKEITTNILARDFFELTSADNQDYRRAYMVKNTSNDTRNIVFSRSINETNPTKYVALPGKGELFIVLLGKNLYEGGSFVAFEPHGASGETGATNDPVIIGGLFGYYVDNPQIRRMQIGAIDNLTTTSADDALAASQGKVLNDKIGGDLSNLTTADKSSLINAINELNTRISNL